MNPSLANDVDDDSVVAPLDALTLINAINQGRTKADTKHNLGEPYFDVDNDGFITPLDVLHVINALNSADLHVPTALHARVIEDFGSWDNSSMDGEAEWLSSDLIQDLAANRPGRKLRI